MLNPDPTLLLYMSSHSNPAGWSRSDTLLLDPPTGRDGSVFIFARKSQVASESLTIPFTRFDQNALAHVILTAINEPHRGRGKAQLRKALGITNSTKLAILSSEHWITKAWLQFFRARLLKFTLAEISTDLSIAYSQWRRWEGSNPHLPPLQWTHLLWRWWQVNLVSLRSTGPIRWDSVINENDRANLRKSWRKGYYRQQVLHDPLKDVYVDKLQENNE